ncbi:MAG TPA: DUF2971 domain-containing protein [Methylobacter sp.]
MSEPQVDQEIATIEDGYLWCSDFRLMNDPMEGLYEADHSFRSHPRYHQLVDIILQNKRDIGICSFSETPKNELMWAHYADQFRGICVEYDLRKLLDGLPDNIDIIRIHYDERMPAISLNSRTPTMEIAKQILSCKNYSWLYEREWRLLGHTGKLDYRDNCITNVYIGPRMPDRIKSRLTPVLRRLHIPNETLQIEGYRLR